MSSVEVSQRKTIDLTSSFKIVKFINFNVIGTGRSLFAKYLDRTISQKPYE